jgi:hypothetical protein
MGIIKAICISLLILLIFTAGKCGNKSQTVTQSDNDKPFIYQGLSDEQLLDTLQYYTFQYFWDGAEPNSGMARERIHLSGLYPNNDEHVITTGGSGFGLMAILVGIERGFISRKQGLIRVEKIAEFLENADRFHGAWPHWMDGKTGKVVPFGKKDDGGDLVETSFLAQGLICVQEYFKNGIEREKLLSEKIETLWQGIEYSWYEKDASEVLYWHWSPNYDWEMNFPLKGYNECLITYIIGAATPYNTINPNSYHKGWAREGDIVKSQSNYGYTLDVKHNGNPSAGGPLFWAHYSYLGFNPKITSDQYANYWDINVAHTLTNRTYCIQNPKQYKGYSEDLWGLTASYSIQGYGTWEANGGRDKDDLEANELHMGYAAHNPDKDYGIISPTAALSSFPYAPDECMKVAKHIYFELGNKAFGKYGPYDAFSIEEDWFPKTYLAIDQGPIVCMIENYRSNLLWNLFMGNTNVKKGLERLEISVNKK